MPMEIWQTLVVTLQKSSCITKNCSVGSTFERGGAIRRIDFSDPAVRDVFNHFSSSSFCVCFIRAGYEALDKF